MSVPLSQGKLDVGGVMRRVIYALLPAIAVHIYFFGPGLLWNILLAATCALIAEALVLLLRRRSLLMYLTDGSAVVTAVLLAFAVPPFAPWWLIVVGVIVAIVFAKQMYGGLGYNPFNPAMAGYAVLLISFPREMSQWPQPLMLQDRELSVWQGLQLIGEQGTKADWISSASPLETWRVQIDAGQTLDVIQQQALFGQWGYAGGEWVALAVLVGGLWLLWQRIISWQIPLSLLTAVVLFAGIFHLVEPQRYADPLFHLLTGATLLGAFFIATDPVSAPSAPRAQLIYGAAIGTLIVIIRSWGGFPDGVAFAVLLMNMTSPLLDQYIKTRVFGTRTGEL